MRSLSDKEPASQTVRAGVGTWNFLPSQRCRVPLSIHRKKIVLRRRAFWDFENFSTFFQLPSVHSLWLCEPSRSLVVSSFGHPGFTLSTLSRTHKSLLARTTPSIRYRSPVIGLPTHEVFVRQRAGESNRKSRCRDLEFFCHLRGAVFLSLYIVND